MTKSWRIGLWVLTVGTVFYFLYLVRAILAPFVVAVIISVLLDPTIRRLRLRGWPRWAAVSSVFVGFFALITLVSILLAPVIGQQVSKMRERFDQLSSQLAQTTEFETMLQKHRVLLSSAGLPTEVEPWTRLLGQPFAEAAGYQSAAQLQARLTAYDRELGAEGLPTTVKGWSAIYDAKHRSQMQKSQEQAESRIDGLLAANRPTLERLNLPTTRQEWVAQYFDPYKEQMADGIQSFLGGFLGIVSTVASGILLLGFTPLITFFILWDLEDIKRRSATWIPPAIRVSTMGLMRDISDVFVKYVRGMTLILLTYSTVTSVLLSVLGAPYAIIMGVLISLLGLIPTIGAFISYAVTFAVVGVSGKTGNFMFDLGSPWAFAGLIVFCLFLVLTAMDQILYPKLVGTAVGLSPAVSMFVLFSAGALFGLVGTMIAFPLAGAAKVVLDRILRVATGGEASLALPRVPLRHRAGSG